MDLVSISGVGPELAFEGKVYRLSLFTLGVRAAFSRICRQQYMARVSDAIAAMSASDRREAMASAVADVLAGKADFGYAAPGDSTAFAISLFCTFDGQASLLRLLLAAKHPEVTDELAARMLLDPSAAAAMEAVFPKPPTPVPPTGG